MSALHPNVSLGVGRRKAWWQHQFSKTVLKTNICLCLAETGEVRGVLIESKGDFVRMTQYDFEVPGFML